MVNKVIFDYLNQYVGKYGLSEVKKKILSSVLQARAAGFSIDFLTEGNIPITNYAIERNFDLLIICGDSNVEFQELESSATDLKLKLSPFFN